MWKEVKLSELRIGVCLCKKNKKAKNGRVELEEAITKIENEREESDKNEM